VTVAKIITYLKTHHLTLGTIESFTGGSLANNFVQVPGASAVFKQGLVLYQPNAKAGFLGRSVADVEKLPIVSKVMVESLLNEGFKRALADLVIVTTGYAGPTADDPIQIGLVWLGVADHQHRLIKTFQFQGDRISVQQQGIVAAIRMLETFLSDYYDMTPEKLL
jgi:PncC family amidohydrolase